MVDQTSPVALFHTPDPSRWRGAPQHVHCLPSTGTAQAMAEDLDGAALLVVDDALAFPFEDLRDVDRDVPLAVRLPAPLDAPGLEAVLGNDLLDHLTPLDIVAGDPGAWGPVLGRRHLPATRWVGPADLTVEQLVNRAHRWRQRLDEWRPRPVPRGAPLDVIDLSASADPGPQRLRRIKSRLRVERDLLRNELRDVALQQPRTRMMKAGIMARQPEVFASALPSAVEWIAILLVPSDEPSADIVSGRVPVIEVPGHLRLPRSAGELDVVVVAADMLHSPRHAIERLLAESVRLLRPGGWLLLLSETVPDPARPVDTRPRPLGAGETLEVVARASGRQMVLEDLRSFRRPGEDHHRAGLFRWRYLGSERGGTSWM